MKIHKSYKTELDLNVAQTKMCYQYAGAARFVYNWALNLLTEDYKSEKKLKPNSFMLQKLLTTKKQTDFAWLYEAPSRVTKFALDNVEAAFKNFFRKLKIKDPTAGYPQFKKKGQHDSFTLDQSITVEKDRIKIPKIGWVKLKEHEYIPCGEPNRITISLRANRWFVSAMYEEEIVNTPEYENSTIGVDLGVKSLAITSDNDIFESSKKLNKKQEMLNRLQRKLARQTKGSNSRNDTKKKIAKVHFDISNHRKDILDKLTTYLVLSKPQKTIVIEDLNVSGMMKNHNLAKSIANIGFHEFRRQLEYKCKWYGKELVVANRFYPSSKLCSCCGNKKEELKLSERKYTCEVCGNEIDRDLNAAINLSKYNPEEWDKLKNLEEALIN